MIVILLESFSFVAGFTHEITYTPGLKLTLILAMPFGSVVTLYEFFEILNVTLVFPRAFPFESVNI